MVARQFLSETFKAWVAGFIDGEGSITVYRYNKTCKKGRLTHPPYFGLKFFVGCSDLTAIEKIRNGFGYGYINTQKRKNIKGKILKTMYILQFSSNQAKKVLKEILPYLVTKRWQAGLALQFPKRKTINRGNQYTVKTKTNLPDLETQKKQEEFYWKLKELNGTILRGGVLP